MPQPENISSTVKPFAGLYDFVKVHILVVNAVVLFSTVVVGVLDFLLPAIKPMLVLMYWFTGILSILMFVAAVFPGIWMQVTARLGYTRVEGLAPTVPLHQRAAWRGAVVLLIGVTFAGIGSLAKAKDGGVLATSFPSIKSLQESILSLKKDTAQIKDGVASANVKLDTLVADSQDPQKDLVARGYPFTGGGLMQAIKQGDQRAVGLFAKVRFRVEYVGTMAVLMNGPQPWDQEIADMLTKDMFIGREACQVGGFFQG